MNHFPIFKSVFSSSVFDEVFKSDEQTAAVWNDLVNWSDAGTWQD